MRVSFYTLGCKVNQAETRMIEEQFSKYGYSSVPFTEPAEVIVINTCSVTHIAERKARNIIRRSIANNPGSKIIVCGCYSNLEAEKLKKEIPEVAAFIPQNIKVDISKWGVLKQFKAVGSRQKLRKKQFLKIQDGCDNYCSYCVIPFARPKLSSLPLQEIMEEAYKLIPLGVKELVVSGINVGKYYDSERNNLVTVLRNLDNCPALERFSLSSIEPECVTDELIEFVRTSKKMVKHLHIPLQSGSTKILKLMNRKYDVLGYKKIIQKLRQAVPELKLTTDIIVGFPGENKETFQETMDTVRDIGFADIHIFRYSPRPNTKAALMENKLSVKECDKFIEELEAVLPA